MATSKLLTVGKLFVILVVAGVVASLFVLPYIGGAGLLTRKEADRFLDAKCDVDFSKVATDQTSTLYANDNKTVIATFFSQNRVAVPLSSISQTTREALIDTEDRRFYDHHGIDPRGMARAALNESDGDTQGASTLTQQYVKQVKQFEAKNQAEYDAAGAQTADRKIVEAKCAIGLEATHTKDQILNDYFNIAFFGEHSYGIEVAARTYFSTEAAKLTVPQAAMLAGIVQAPTSYDPFLHPAAATTRRNEVIQNMVTAHHLTQAQADAYKAAPLGTNGSQQQTSQQGCAYANPALLNAGFFCDYLVSWLQNKGGISPDVLSRGGLRIKSSLSPHLQNSTQTAVWKNFDANSKSATIMPQVNPTTGEIVAMATSKHYDLGQSHANNPAYTTVPLFTTPAAGAGSTFKYFSTVAALTAGAKDTTSIYTPIPYLPTNCPNADPSNPANYIRNAGGYPSTMTLRNALVQSSNTYFVGLEDQFFGCNLTAIVQTARNLGVTMTDKQARDIIDGTEYTFTLGQFAVSPLDLTVAYSAAANDGKLCSPKPVESITDSSGQPVKFTQASCAQKMSPWVAREVINMMTGDSTGGTAAAQFGQFYGDLGEQDHLVASKTGTNNATYQPGEGGPVGQDNQKNGALWFVGLTPTIAAAVAIYDPQCPTCTITLPGSNDTSDDFGAMGAFYAWVPALQPYFATQPGWTWSDPTQIPGAQQLQTYDYVGQTDADVAGAIKAAGYVPAKYPVNCGSNAAAPGTVASVGPQYATPGETVYYCMSNGTGFKYEPQKPNPPKTNAPSNPAPPNNPTPPNNPSPPRGTRHR